MNRKSWFGQAGTPNRMGQFATPVLLGYGLLNAALYAGLLPLWEGWDEPFHYGCVQEISRQGRLPLLGRAVLSQEIWNSLELAPMAEGVKRNVRRGVTFGDYYRWPREQRFALRSRLNGLDPKLGWRQSFSPNYEAQQPPLAYALLAPLDAAWSRARLPQRIMRLRLACGFGAVLLTGWAVLRLAGLLGLPAIYGNAALFLVFSSQIFYAATVHITNDWLAVPLFCMLMAQAVALYRAPRIPAGVWLGAMLGAALLTKAYFLPVACLEMGVAALCVWRRKLPLRGALAAALLCFAIAGPWYAGNLARGNLSGMQETVSGIPPGQLLHAAVRLPWLAALWSTSHSALWTGNNSYLTFNGMTLSILLLLLVAAAVLYMGKGRWVEGEWIAASGIAVQTMGLAYATVIFFWSSRGAAFTPSPWYWQALWPAAAVLAMAGCSRGGSAGRWLAVTIVSTWTYLIVVTYLAKLIPFYAGLSDGRAHVSDLAGWYGWLWTDAAGSLGTTALLPPRMVIGLAVLVSAASAALAARLCYSMATAKS